MRYDRTVTRMPRRLDPARLAGPECLGRSVLVAPGQAAPGPWTDAPRVVVDTSAPDAAAGRRLREAWTRRQRLVIEAHGEIPDERQSLSAPWWELHPGVTLGSEVWHHLMTANTVDARPAAACVFAPLERALDLGAAVSDTGGDVTAADGAGTLWCDGGPLDCPPPQLLDHSGLVCAVNLAAGRLTPLTAAEPSAELAVDQHAAVSHLGGGACVVAPAGSGKTRVLTERSRWLVNGLGVTSDAVCLVAYNVRARAEMAQRSRDVEGLQIRTLNSLALAICNGTGPFVRPHNTDRVEVITERDARDLLYPIVAEHTTKRQRRAMTDPLAAWIEALSATRLGLRDPAEVENDYDGDVDGLARVAPLYAQRLAERRVVDFDHQIITATDTLLADPAARAAARRACGILLVDEFQDLTPAHLLMLRVLAGPAAEVFGVGDDDQTIYGYSGASPRWLIEYSRWFPGAGRHLLGVNYRCPPKVVAAASRLLAHNRERIDKQITPHPDRADDTDVAATACTDPGSVVLDRVQTLLDEGAACEDIAVLTRVNSTLLTPQIVLGEAGIDSMQPVGEWFLERTGVAAALAWLDLTSDGLGNLSPASLAAAARRPPRGLSHKAVGWVAEQSSLTAIRKLARRITDFRTSSRIGEFADDLERLADIAFGGADTRRMLEAIRDTAGLGASLNDRLDASRRTIDRSAHGDDLAALISVAAHCPAPEEFGQWLRQRLADTPNPDAAGSRDWGSGVRLATVHRVKGLEWPHVIVLSANDGLMPHRLASDTEEERRVFHVALTRCSQTVLVVSDGPPSPFIAETGASTRPSPQAQAPAAAASPPAPPPPAAAAAAGDEEHAERALFERLRQWRLERSRAADVPACILFSDATLRQLSQQRPLTDEALLAVPGIGPAKLDTYGAELKALLAAA